GGFWSRAILVDYAALALSLAWLHLAMIWSERRTGIALAGCLAFGALAAATKITTLAALLAPVCAVAAAAFARSAGPLRRTATGAVAIPIVPLAAGLGWTRYTDAVKAVQPYTRFL